MTHVGLASLFGGLKVLNQAVYPSTGPIHTLVWLLRYWLAGLKGTTKEDFLNMRVRDLTVDVHTYLDKPFVTELSEAVNFSIASATVLKSVKEVVAATGKVRRRWDSSHVLAWGLTRCNRLLRSDVGREIRQITPNGRPR
jgi:hypothetical protein